MYTDDHLNGQERDTAFLRFLDRIIDSVENVGVATFALVIVVLVICWIGSLG